jgi:Protein of unknown function (DUF3455)
MNPVNASNPRARRSIRSVASATALALTLTAPLSLAAKATEVIVPPQVPPGLEIDDGSIPFLVGQGVGTPNYVCSPSGAGFAWILFTPEATLFNDTGKQLTTHFFSANPDESNPDSRVVADGAIRATWQHSRDTSAVWANGIAQSSDAPFVRPNAVAWVKLEVVGKREGPGGGDTLVHTTFIQRVNTDGGVAPATGCSGLADVGKKAFRPYTADYIFYFNPNAEQSN